MKKSSLFCWYFSLFHNRCWALTFYQEGDRGHYWTDPWSFFLVSLSRYIRNVNKCFQERGIKKVTTATKRLKINYKAIVERDVNWWLLVFRWEPAFHFWPVLASPVFWGSCLDFMQAGSRNPSRTCPLGAQSPLTFPSLHQACSPWHVLSQPHGLLACL